MLALCLAACGGGASPGSPAPGEGPPAQGEPPACLADPGAHTGQATFYAFANGDGACMFGPSPGDLMVGAMNPADFEGSRACGACVALTGPAGSIRIRIVDLCPGCARGDVDLSPDAFARLSPLAAGRVPISWRYVSCDLAGPIRYHFKEGSNAFWLAVQVRNHANRVARVEALDGGRYEELARAGYNFFLAPAGLGSGPLALRVTDVHGQSTEDAAVRLVEGGDSAGAGQFPACAGP